MSGGGEGKRGVWDGPGLTVGRARRRKIKGQISEEGGKGKMRRKENRVTAWRAEGVFVGSILRRRR